MASILSRPPLQGNLNEPISYDIYMTRATIILHGKYAGMSVYHAEELL